jgi:prepilin-type N-terminal cleavage/methylation domain-containing protein
MKMLNRKGSLGRKREGFTLIELLIVMVILAILAGIVIISIGGVIGRGHATAYNADREQIEAAVAEFMTRPTDMTYNHTIGEVPLTGGGCLDASAVPPEINGSDVIPGELYCPVAVCTLTTSSFPKGILKQIPATVHNSNCVSTGANAEDGVDAQCIASGDAGSLDGHYVWYATSTGDCASVCLGAECTNPNTEDGFQDIYP